MAKRLDIYSFISFQSERDPFIFILKDKKPKKKTRIENTIQVTRK